MPFVTQYRRWADNGPQLEMAYALILTDFTTPHPSTFCNDILSLVHLSGSRYFSTLYLLFLPLYQPLVFLPFCFYLLATDLAAPFRRGYHHTLPLVTHGSLMARPPFLRFSLKHHCIQSHSAALNPQGDV